MKANTSRKPKISPPPLALVKPPAGPQWKAPAYLRPATREWFAGVAETYDLERHHVLLLTKACEALDRGESARAIVAKKGMTYTDRFGQPCARPEVAIERDARIAFARLLRELALDVVDEPAPSRPPGLTGRRR